MPSLPAEMRLTRRETDVLECLARGQSYARIAQVLGISLGTVQTHVKRIYRKLRVSSKAAATAVALTHALVPRPAWRPGPRTRRKP